MKPNKEFRLPRADEHTAIVGRNGTGKSQAGAWVLSKRDLRNQINIILDYKGEELFNSLERVREIGLGEMPKKNGLYIIHAHPGMDDDVENWFWRVWERENVGLFIDEGYMIPSPENGGFQAILTQGRSKRIPVITLSQRPVKVSRFAFSEASHIGLFDLNDRRDQKTIGEILPSGFVEWVPPEFDDELPPYHFRWYNVKDNSRFVLRPVPSADEIVADIDGQLEEKKRWL